MIVIIMVYTAAFPQSGSSSAGISVISVSDIGQAASTGKIPLLFLKSAVKVQVMKVNENYWGCEIETGQDLTDVW